MIRAWERSDRLAQPDLVFERGAPKCNAASNPDFEDQKPLTLALSRRERELTEVNAKATSTCNTESCSDFERPTNGSLSLGRGLG